MIIDKINKIEDFNHLELLYYKCLISFEQQKKQDLNIYIFISIQKII